MEISPALYLCGGNEDVTRGLADKEAKAKLAEYLAYHLPMVCDWRVVTLQKYPSAYHGSYDLDFADYTTSGTMAFLLLKNREGALLERLMRWVSEHTLPIDIPDHELATYRKGYMTEGTLFE